MRKVILPFVLGLILVMAVAAQAPQRLLSDADVKEFVSEFKPMSEELDAIGQAAGVNLENLQGLDALLETLRTNADAQRILRKYGWSDARFQKFSAIFASYFALKLDAAEVEVGKVAAQIAEVENNPQLSAEQKATVKAQISETRQAIADAQRFYRGRVHPADLETIKANEDGLDEVFDN